MTEKAILILSNESDITTDLVVKRLRERGVPYMRLNTERFPLAVDGTIRMTDPVFDFELRTSSKHIIGGSILSVWYRRPLKPDLGGLNLTADEVDFAARESEHFLANVWSLIDSSKWVNDPYASNKAELKSLQLTIAARIGLLVPPTLFTNNSRHLMAFAESLRRNIKVDFTPCVRQSF